MTELRKIAAAMGGEVVGNAASFPTPGHSKRDRGSTATIVPGAPDGVLVHSFNGGDPLAIKDMLRAKGVLPERTRPERPRDVAAWEYQDADGVTIYRKVRMALPDGVKSYRFEHPDGRGGWLSKRGDAPQVPYRLPDLIAAAPAATVFMAEGEKHADKLAGWGLVATSLRDWRQEFGRYVTGRTVIILPDNDQAGAEQAEKARKAVEAAGGRPVLVNLPGLPLKGDIMDWTGDAAALQALVEKAINPPAPMLALLDPGAWEGRAAPAREWVLKDWIPARQATYLTGAGSSGKSLLAQQLATCVALGRPFLGVETQQEVAVYITCEDDADELHRRQEAICKAMGVRMSDLSGKLHLASLAGAIGNELATFDPLGRMSATDAYARLRATVMQTGAGFIALDNVAHLFSGNENIRNQVAAFCGLLNGLAADADAAVLFIGHPNKAGNDFSGSTAWENQVRSRLFLDRPRDAEGVIVDPDARVLSRAKANYARNGETLAFRWHQWAFVREDDLPPNVGAEIAANIQASADNKTFLDCLAKATADRRAVSHVNGTNYAPRIFAAMPEAKGMKAFALGLAMNRLLSLEVIRLDQPLWRAPNRVMRQGIKLAAECADDRAEGASTPAPTPCIDPHRPPSQVIDNPCIDPHASTPLYTPYITGGAADGPPPFKKMESCPAGAPVRVDGMILALGETGDEPVPGWEDLS